MILLQVTIEFDDNQFIASDDYTNNYGVGETPYEAYRDFLLSSMEYLDIVGPIGFESGEKLKEYNIICLQCKNAFLSQKDDKKFCTQECRDLYYRK